MVNQDIKRRLLALNDAKRVPHAVILEGPEGIGKKTLGTYFASMLFCERENKPCGVCPSCQKLKSGNHPDYIEIKAEKGKKNISVERVREMTEELFIKPVIAEKKVVFIPEADLCDAPAQNAMLKCFEEPPTYACLILGCKNLSSLLETVKSRAQIFTLNPAKDSEIKKFVLENYPEMAEIADFVASFSGGIIGKAKLLCENPSALTLREKLFSHLLGLSEGRLSALNLSDFLAENEEDEAFLEELMLSFFIDLLLLKKGGSGKNKDYAEKISAFGQGFSENNVAKALFLLSEAKEKRAKYANYSLWITNLIISVWEVLNGKGNRA